MNTKASKKGWWRVPPTARLFSYWCLIFGLYILVFFGFSDLRLPGGDAPTMMLFIFGLYFFHAIEWHHLRAQVNESEGEAAQASRALVHVLLVSLLIAWGRDLYRDYSRSCTDQRTVASVGGCNALGNCGVQFTDGSYGKISKPVVGQSVCLKREWKSVR